MKFTPKEVAELLKDKPQQAHYIESLVQKAVDGLQSENDQLKAKLAELEGQKPFGYFCHHPVLDFYEQQIGSSDGNIALYAQPKPSAQVESALKLLQHIRYHEKRHALPREWLTAADDVLGTFRPVKLTHELLNTPMDFKGESK